VGRGLKGVQLVISDSHEGLKAAISKVLSGATWQRCRVHKLRNISKATQLPDDLDPDERRRKRRAILADFKAIWQAKQYQTLLRRYLQVHRQYRASQPAAVAVLRRDFRATLTYYAIEQQHPTWPRRFLRTTSRLERFNRPLCKRCRSAGAYHSDEGILAMVAQTADAAFQPGTGSICAKRRTIPTEQDTLPWLGFFQGECFTVVCNALCCQPSLRRLADVTAPVLGRLVARKGRPPQPVPFGPMQLPLREAAPASP